MTAGELWGVRWGVTGKFHLSRGKREHAICGHRFQTHDGRGDTSMAPEHVAMVPDRICKRCVKCAGGSE